MMCPLSSLALRHPAMSANSERQRAATVAAMPGPTGFAHNACRSRSSFSIDSNRRIFFSASSVTAAGDCPVRAAFSASSAVARVRASSISRSNKSSRRRCASWFMALLQAALELEQLVGDAGGVDLISTGAHGLLHGGHLGGVHHRGLRNGLFELVQGARRARQGHLIARLRDRSLGRTRLVLLFGYSAVAVRTLDGCDRLRGCKPANFLRHRTLLGQAICPANGYRQALDEL